MEEGYGLDGDILDALDSLIPCFLPSSDYFQMVMMV